MLIGIKNKIPYIEHTEEGTFHKGKCINHKQIVRDYRISKLEES